MQRRSGSFRSTTGQTLHTLNWLPEAEPTGLAVLVHGYGEHAGRYGSLARALLDEGIAVHALDFPGHGRSGGRRGEVASFEELVADLGAYTSEVRSEKPQLGCGLIGHSMGGAVSAALAARWPEAVDAVVLSSPYLRHGKPVPPAQARALRFLARLAPRLGVDRVDPEALSRLPHEVDAYRSDPLVHHGRVGARTAVQLFRGFETLEDAGQIRVPLLIVHGSDDRIAHPSASRELAQGVSSRDVTLELVEGGYHELLNDNDGERVRRLIVEWLKRRISRVAGARDQGTPN